MRKKALKIGITIGDPAGVGPEVAVKAINSIDNKCIIPVLIGRKEVLSSLYPDHFKDFKILESAA
ncbi:MAG: hypothetical protein GY756_14530, partial [bacterium]|nr:hypothetical protein [bacterium]